MSDVKIIASGIYWVCENMDTLAPITEEGIEYLLSDGSRVYVKNGECYPGVKPEMANDAEKRAFASQEYGSIFKGDTIVIHRGRKMVGEVKKVKGYYRYDVPGTYGKQYTEYLLFDDGTKCNLQHCDVVGINHKSFVHNGQRYSFRKYEDTLNILTFSVGGRL